MAVLATAAALALGACGGDNSSGSVSTTAVTTAAPATTTAGSTPVSASAALCNARSALQTSVQDLTKIDLVQNGTNGVKDALTKVKDNLTAVKAAAGNDLQPQVTAFQDALQQLQTAVDASSAASIATSLKSVIQTGTTLLTDLGKLSCP